MRILFTGSRTWTDVELIKRAIYAVVIEHGSLREDTVFVHGACPRGADKLVDDLGKLWGVAVEKHPADWSVGRAAGFIRNAHMVELGADVCLAFIKDDSKGATHTANLAEAAGMPTVIYRV